MPKSLYYSTGLLAKFHQKWLGKNSEFLSFFLIHIHVLMLYIKFELILMKIEFFYKFLKLLPKTMERVFHQNETKKGQGKTE